MAVIKRYPNRKLYNLDTKQYITLDGIATLVSQGVNISVIDHTSGDDLTDLTFAQIILENQKNQVGLLSRSTLEKLIRISLVSFEEENLPIVYSAHIDHLVNHEIKRRINFLVSDGKLSLEVAEKLLEKLLSDNKQLNDDNSKQKQAIILSPIELENFIDQWEIASQKDLIILHNQIQELTNKLEKLNATML